MSAKSSDSEDEEQMSYTPCTVCGDANTYNDDILMDCSECHAIFHQSCYGLQNQKLNIATSPFTCYYCIELAQATKKIIETKKCQLCSVQRNELAITTINQRNIVYGKWVHIICAYSFECKYNCDKAKQPSQVIIGAVKESKYDKTGKCCICNTMKGHKSKCSHPKCFCKIHPSCARMEINKNCDGNDDFYFTDIYSDRLFRTPLFFCSEHNIENSDELTRKDDAIKMIKKWNQKKTSKNRKRKRQKLKKIAKNEQKHKRQKLNEKSVSNTVDSELSESVNISEESPKVRQDCIIANVHDFRYSIDKCYCYKCLEKQIIIKQEREESKEEMSENDCDNKKYWFNEMVWFQMKYSLNDISVENKGKFIAEYCKNMNIKTDYSAEYSGNESECMSFVLNGLESVAMYNHSAINGLESENKKRMPSKPFRKVDKSGAKLGALFHREMYRDVFMNVGGTVMCLDFCPLNKYYNLNGFNYLAIVSDMHKYHSIDANNAKECLIQIWKIKKKFVKKSNAAKHGWMKAKNKHKNAIFHYGIVHKHGFIWDTKWLPFKVFHKLSDEFNDTYQRLGVLAVCGDNGIYIYSLPFITKNNAILTIEPVVLLKISLQNNGKFLRLLWSTNIMYPMLIVSTSNGCIALWDLRTITNELLSEKCDTNVINDKQLNLLNAYGDNDNILGIDWCNDKYFVTISEKGCLKLWDINNLYVPILSRKLNAFCTDIKWVSGMDSAIVSNESYAANKKNKLSNTGRSGDCCTKFIAVWPQQNMESESGTNDNLEMGSVIQFPSEKLFNVCNKVAYSVDILLKCDCNNHGSDVDLTECINSSNQLISNKNVTLYVAVGYNSGNVILYQHKLNQLCNTTKAGNGQILSQVICNGNGKNSSGDSECSFVGPFYGINSNVYKNQCNVSRYIWSEKNNENTPIYDPYHLHPTKLALNDNVTVKKVKICPNDKYLDVVSGSISGIVRIQTVSS